MYNMSFRWLMGRWRIDNFKFPNKKRTNIACVCVCMWDLVYNFFFRLTTRSAFFLLSLHGQYYKTLESVLVVVVICVRLLCWRHNKSTSRMGLPMCFLGKQFPHCVAFCFYLLWSRKIFSDLKVDNELNWIFEDIEEKTYHTHTQTFKIRPQAS